MSRLPKKKKRTKAKKPSRPRRRKVRKKSNAGGRASRPVPTLQPRPEGPFPGGDPFLLPELPLVAEKAQRSLLEGPPWKSSAPYLCGMRKLPLAGWVELGTKLALGVDLRFALLPGSVKTAIENVHLSAQFSRKPFGWASIVPLVLMGGLILAPFVFRKDKAA